MIKRSSHHSQSSRSDKPNRRLALKIVESNDVQSVKELIALIKSNQKEIQNDCIKVIYKIGILNPHLIKPYFSDLMEALTSKNIKLQDGAMLAIKTISDHQIDNIYKNLIVLEDIATHGLLRTKKTFIRILAKLLDHSSYYPKAYSQLITQLIVCFPKELSKYTKLVIRKIKPADIPLLKKTILSRIDEINKTHKREKLIKILST